MATTVRIKYVGTAKDEDVPRTFSGLVPDEPIVELGEPAAQRAGVEVSPAVAHILTGSYGFKLVEPKGVVAKPKTIDELAAERQKARSGLSSEEKAAPAAPPAPATEGGQ